MNNIKRCNECNTKPVYLGLCKKHFIGHIENRVKDTIKKYSLLNKKKRVAVAVSGGKDSLSCLNMLNKFRYAPEAIIIDEGISGYREITLEWLKDFCKRENIVLKVISFKEEFGFTLDEIIEKYNLKPCSVCGILRRYLLNKYSRKYDVIATAHNLDDEAQAVLMNLLRNSMQMLARQGPVSGYRIHKKFTKRVKPLYFCSEKEIFIYSFLLKLKSGFVECPYVKDSFRAKVRDFLNAYEDIHKGTKLNIINSFLDISERLRPLNTNKEIPLCSNCGQPSSNKLCNTCLLLKKFKSED